MLSLLQTAAIMWKDCNALFVRTSIYSSVPPYSAQIRTKIYEAADGLNGLASNINRVGTIAK